MRNVLYCCPKLDLSGAPWSCLHLARAVRRRGFSPSLFIARGGPLERRFEGEGIPVHRLADCRARLRAALSELAPDLVHVNSVHEIGVPIARLARRRRIPVVWHVREDPTSTRVRRLWPLIRSLSSVVVTNCLDSRDRLLPRAGRVPVVAVWNGLDEDLFFRERSAAGLRSGRHGVPAGTKIVGTVGHVKPRKGTLPFVRAAARVLQDRRDVVFVVCGRVERGKGKDESYLQTIEEFIDRHGLNERVLLIGEHASMAALYQDLDIVVLPSRWDATSRVLLEAMACARPVVATRVGGLPEVLDHGRAGLLVDVDDDAAMAREILNLLGSPEEARRLAQAGRERFERLFTIEKHADAMTGVYRRVLHQAGRSRAANDRRHRVSNHSHPSPLAGEPAAARGRRWRGGAARAALFAASTLVGLLGLEAGVRLAAPQLLGLRYLSREGVELHYPGAQVDLHFPGRVSRVSVNSDGLRDREYVAVEPTSARRILVLGDNLTEGLHVGDGQVWPKLVERTLNVEAAGPIEIVNAAMTGQGTSDQLRYLMTYGKRWKPELVLLAFYAGNDVRDNLHDRRLKRRGAEIIVEHRGRQGWLRFRMHQIRSWLVSHSHVYQLARARLGRIGPDPLRITRPEHTLSDEGWFDGVDDLDMIRSSPPRATSDGWAITEALLDRMMREAERLGARFAVVSLPSRSMVDGEFLASREPGAIGEQWDPAGPGRRIMDWARRRGVPGHDLYAAFHGAQGAGSLFVAGDVHWSGDGHRVAAGAIRQFLKSLGPDAGAGTI